MALSPILASYSALVPVSGLALPPDIPFSVAHEFFLQKILLNRHLGQYPPSPSYQQRFWKWAIAQLESLIQSDEDDEIDERIYAHYLSLKPVDDRLVIPSDSFVTYYYTFPAARGYPTGCETITLVESRTTIGAGTTGLRTWRASLFLAQYLVQHPHLVDASNVLELGSGTGFIGILVASLQLRAAGTSLDRGTPSIYLTDVNSTVLERCQNNVKLPCNRSSSHSAVHYKSLNWLESLSDQESMMSMFSDIKADIVLGADIVFDPTLVPALVRTISLSLSSECTRCMFVALTVRNEDTLTYFLDEIQKVLTLEKPACDLAGHVLSQIPDQVDAKFDVQLFKIKGTPRAHVATYLPFSIPDLPRFVMMVYEATYRSGAHGPPRKWQPK